MCSVVILYWWRRHIYAPVTCLSIFDNICFVVFWHSMNVTLMIVDDRTRLSLHEYVTFNNVMNFEFIRVWYIFSEMCENICKYWRFQEINVNFFSICSNCIGEISSSVQGALKNLDDSSILTNLKERFQNRIIYVSKKELFLGFIFLERKYALNV